MVEPLSLLPLLRARCKHLVLAGDPCQLPPMVASPAMTTGPQWWRWITVLLPNHGSYGIVTWCATPLSHSSTNEHGLTGTPTGSTQRVHGLARPLFERLAAAGHRPILLRRQYRCHPALSAIPNRLFYGGQLLDGCTAAQRAPLVPGLPPLCFINVECVPVEHLKAPITTSGPITCCTLVAALQRSAEWYQRSAHVESSGGE